MVSLPVQRCHLVVEKTHYTGRIYIINAILRLASALINNSVRTHDFLLTSDHAGLCQRGVLVLKMSQIMRDITIGMGGSLKSPPPLI